METHQMNKARLLLRSGWSKGVSHSHLCFGRDLKAGRREGKLHSRKKEGSRFDQRL